MSDISKMKLDNNGGMPPRGSEVYEEYPSTPPSKYMYVSALSMQGPMVGAIKTQTLEVPVDYRPESDAPFSTRPFPKLRKMFSEVMQDLLMYQDERTAFKTDNICILSFSWIDAHPAEV